MVDRYAGLTAQIAAEKAKVTPSAGASHPDQAGDLTTMPELLPFETRRESDGTVLADKDAMQYGVALVTAERHLRLMRAARRLVAAAQIIVQP